MNLLRVFVKSQSLIGPGSEIWLSNFDDIWSKTVLPNVVMPQGMLLK